MAASTGNTNRSAKVFNSLSKKPEKKHYTIPAETKLLEDHEHPIKYWDDKEKLRQFQEKFPGVSLQALKDEYESKDEEGQKMTRRKLWTEKSIGTVAIIEPLFKEVKRISGCDCKLKNHISTMKSFASLQQGEKLATFYCECKHKKFCGVKRIIIHILSSREAEICFEPTQPSNDIEFYVTHSENTR